MSAPASSAPIGAAPSIPAPDDRSRLRALLPAPSLHPATPATAGSDRRSEDGYVTPPLREFPKEFAKYQLALADASAAPSSLPLGKRKRLDLLTFPAAPTAKETSRQEPVAAAGGRRKCSSDFLRKGQWTATEERLAGLLIEAFEQGYLPIYTGIRLRGYLAVQLQCDPMRVSKKLCAGTVAGRRIPKNYGQKKFKLRKKAAWDRDEAGRLLAELEQLTKDMWRESGVAPPPFLTLSSTRSAEEDHQHQFVALDDVTSPPSPVRRLSPSASKLHKSVVFPIIYLNLSKKRKAHQGTEPHPDTEPASSSSVESCSTPPTTSDDEDVHEAPVASKRRRRVVDGDSLQAAYDLLTLCRPSSRSASAPSSSPPPSGEPSVAVRAEASC